MLDEKDMNEKKRRLYEDQAKKTVANFKKKNVNAQYVPTRREALATVLEMIPKGAVVGMADSLSLDQIGIVQALRTRNQNQVICPMERDADGHSIVEITRGKHAKREMQREAMISDIFVAGTNAVTLDGKIVNIDGTGNRVAPLIFGPRKVIIVVGVNKIVENVDDAIERVMKFVAPINTKRLYLKHHRVEYHDMPCVVTGTCTDCNHPLRHCRYTTIIDGARPPEKGRINVVLVGEELGI